ncbi:GTPase HflX [Candidatus Poribacteria bacterium]|nr:GTPase HflX [Candidatus Poribacteria bacterium]
MNEEILADRERHEKALLIGIQFPGAARHLVDEHLEELRALTRTLGVEVAATEVVRIAKPSAKYLIGSGKAEELRVMAESLEADVLIFDDDLSPSQQGAWEKLTERAVLDRRKVILDIFAQRAQSREARLQIELASLEYTLPRLKRAWTHLERQRGGGGFVGGAGEAQIEVDRRIIRDRIATLKRELIEVREQRATQRKGRGRRPVPNAAIVGYTNSGKSSLLNTLTDANVLQEDKLFATLDPTTRKVELPNNQQMLLTDTVGFIRKLPTTLVEAFKSTLEESVLADFLLHVVDCAHPQALDHIRATNEILEELGAADKQTILVLNKVDLVPDRAELRRFDGLADHTLATSTVTGEGIPELLGAIASFLRESLADLHLRVPTTRFDIVSAVHREGEVLEEKYVESDVVMHVLFPRRFMRVVEPFVAKTAS